MLELQTQLEATQEQMRSMAENYDGLQQAHAKLQAANDEAERARATAEEKTAKRLEEIAGMEAKLQRLLFSQKFDLLDMKLLQPGEFKLKAMQATRQESAFLRERAPRVRAGG